MNQIKQVLQLNLDSKLWKTKWIKQNWISYLQVIESIYFNKYLEIAISSQGNVGHGIQYPFLIIRKRLYCPISSSQPKSGGCLHFFQSLFQFHIIYDENMMY